MEIPSDAFDTLIQRLRNELTVAIGHCDLLEIDAARQGIGLGSAISVRLACERAAAHLEAWRQAHLTPFTYLVRPEFVEVVVPAAPTASAFETTIEHVLAHPGFRPGMGFLYDRRAAEPPSTEYLESVIRITRRYADRLGHCRWAVIVRADDAITAATVRAAAPRVGPASKPGPFTDINQALRWLTAPRFPQAS
jgi:hypothetical protein